MAADGPDLAGWFEAARSARHCAALTGAGVSAESGVPTFRGENGLWKRYRAEDLATPEAFARNPELVREWYAYRRELLEEIRPNEGHRALADAARAFERFSLVTQNVDGLHELAGSTDVIELHGNIRHDRCNDCGRTRESGAESLHCPCGGLWRPAVVWFGEQLPAEAIEQAFEAAQAAEVFISAGTSSTVFPAAQLPYIAHEAGAFVVEVNPTSTPFSPLADVRVRGPSGEWLPRLFDPLWRDDQVIAGGGAA
jgi:NAD-dependent deacetylase